MVVAHNLIAMNAQRQFNIVGSKKAKSTEKLSSGYRINRAADDAAGLAISEKMRRQIRGLTQGTSNTMDGISLCQVADGALAEVDDMLHRLTELSVQAANGTYTDQDRSYLQEEVNGILEEIDRIGDTTSFNDILLFKERKTSEEIDALAKEERIEKIQSSFYVTSTSSASTGSDTYSINVTPAGIELNGNLIKYDDIKSGTHSLTEKLVAGDYSFEYAGYKFSFSVPANTTVDDLKEALSLGTVFVNKQSKKQQVVTLSNIKLKTGTKTDSLLSSKSVSVNIKADKNGIEVEGYGSCTWAEMGISNIDDLKEKKFSFYDKESGISFDGTIAAGMDINTISEALSKTYKIAEAGVTYANDLSFTKLPLFNISYFHVSNLYYMKTDFSSADNIYNKLGLSTSQTLTDRKMDLTFVSDSPSDLRLKITDSETGNSYIMDLSSDSQQAIYDGSNTNPNLKFTDGTTTIEFVYSKSPGVNKYTTDYYDYFGFLASNGKASATMSAAWKTTSYPAGKADVITYDISTNLPNIRKYVPQENKVEPLSLWIQSGSEKGVGTYINVQPMNTKIIGIKDLNVLTENFASKAIDTVKEALHKVSKNRSEIGAQQNRLEHTVKSNNNVIENTQAAESCIRDTDMAKEMVENSMLEILTQAGVSMMAQANQNNQGILSLLN